MINVIAVFDSATVGDIQAYGRSSQQDFSVETNTDGSDIIYTNQANALLKYTAYVSDTAKFPPAFVDALAWKLASNLAGIIIKGDTGVAASIKCMQAYAAALKTAKESDAQNRKVSPRPLPLGIAARA
jgi:hypothetical protein